MDMYSTWLILDAFRSRFGPERQTDRRAHRPATATPFAYVPRGYKYGFFGVTEIGMHIIYIDMCRLCVIAMVCAY